MEDNHEDKRQFKVNFRETLPEVEYVDEQKATTTGHFLFFANYNPHNAGGIGIVAGILQRNGKVIYREPKNIRFI
jgi:hypothetical protein